jgi:hypothetical protein
MNVVEFDMVDLDCIDDQDEFDDQEECAYWHLCKMYGYMWNHNIPLDHSGVLDESKVCAYYVMGDCDDVLVTDPYNPGVALPTHFSVPKSILDNHPYLKELFENVDMDAKMLNGER